MAQLAAQNTPPTHAPHTVQSLILENGSQGTASRFLKVMLRKEQKVAILSKIDHGNGSKSSQPARFLKVLAEMNQIAVCVF